MTFPKKCLASLGTMCIAFGSSSLPAYAQTVANQPSLTLASAERIITAAEADAAKNGWPGVIAVAGNDGTLIALVRMDNAEVPAGVDLAPGKARTAALFHRPTSDLEAALNGPRHALATAGNFVMLTGGLPIIDNGQVVGAIGVSTALPQHDEQIAEAGAAAFKGSNATP